MEKVINYNQTILNNYQKSYPNLAEFSYDVANDSLVYEGNYIKLNGYALSRIDPVFFNMMPEDIFIYIKNGFYQQANHAELINDYLNQFVITEEEIDFIKKYIFMYIERLNIYARNRDIFDRFIDNQSIKNFLDDIKKAKDIVDKAKSLGTPNSNTVYGFILDAYNGEMSSMNQNKTQEKELSLTRTNPNFAGFQEFDKNEEYLRQLNESQKMNMAGYTSIILIVATALTFGMYLALTFLK